MRQKYGDEFLCKSSHNCNLIFDAHCTICATQTAVCRPRHTGTYGRRFLHSGDSSPIEGCLLVFGRHSLAWPSSFASIKPGPMGCTLQARHAERQSAAGRWGLTTTCRLPFLSPPRAVLAAARWLQWASGVGRRKLEGTRADKQWWRSRRKKSRCIADKCREGRKGANKGPGGAETTAAWREMARRVLSAFLIIQIFVEPPGWRRLPLRRPAASSVGELKLRPRRRPHNARSTQAASVLLLHCRTQSLAHGRTCTKTATLWPKWNEQLVTRVVVFLIIIRRTRARE